MAVGRSGVPAIGNPGAAACPPLALTVCVGCVLLPAPSKIKPYGPGEFVSSRLSPYNKKAVMIETGPVGRAAGQACKNDAEPALLCRRWCTLTMPGRRLRRRRFRIKSPSSRQSGPRCWADAHEPDLCCFCRRHPKRQPPAHGLLPEQLRRGRRRKLPSRKLRPRRPPTSMCRQSRSLARGSDDRHARRWQLPGRCPAE